MQYNLDLSTVAEEPPYHQPEHSAQNATKVIAKRKRCIKSTRTIAIKKRTAAVDS